MVIKQKKLKEIARKNTVCVGGFRFESPQFRGPYVVYRVLQMKQ